MSPCRTLLTMYALSLAFGCMLGLVIANRMLMALDEERENRRQARAEKRMSRDMETGWLLQDTHLTARGNQDMATIEFVADGGETRRN